MALTAAAAVPSLLESDGASVARSAPPLRAAPPLAVLQPRTMTSVIDEAVAAAGARLTGSAWQATMRSQDASWALAFATWLLRDNLTTAASTAAEFYAEFAARGEVGATPRAGALVFYGHGSNESIYHLGIVEKVMGGKGVTVEGDVPGTLGPAYTFVRRFGQPWHSQVVYGYPEYA